MATPVRLATPVEEARGLDLYPLIGMLSEDGQRRISADKLDVELRHRAQGWLTSLLATPVTGLQLDPMGRLAVAAGSDSLAMRQFTARLTTPGLSIEDRGYTLFVATSAFSADPTNPMQMRTALAYLAQLDALSRNVVNLQLQGHVVVGRAYYQAGNTPQVIVHLKHALSLVPALPFDLRGEVFNINESPFVLLADALSGVPNGRQQIDSLGAWLLSYTQPTPTQIASDQSYFWIGQGYTQNLKQLLQFTGYLGRKAPAISANYWWNTTAPTTPSPVLVGATVKSLNDGKIRLMEFGDYGCPGCLAALPNIERIRMSMPANVEVWYVTEHGDTWGATYCTADVAAQHLKHYYIERKHYGLPIALWIGGQTPLVDGGSVSQESPSFTAYPIVGTPWFIVTDGKGIVRHVSFGFSEPLLRRTLQYLLAEAVHTT